jgi:hypothetical protein
MELVTFQYKNKGQQQGWTVNEFPQLDSENTLVIIFAAPEFIHSPSPIHELIQRYPNSKIIGCSSAGEIAGSRISDQSISVAILKFSKTQLRSASIDVKKAQDSYNAGLSIAATLNDKDLRGIFVLSDGLKINGSELVKGLNTIDSDNVVITGGLAGDGSNFQRTWTILNDKISSDSIVAIGFYGDHVSLSHGSQGGWDIFGPERKITRSKHNKLYELDGRPALALYKEYLGEKSSNLPAAGLLFPLAIRKSSNSHTKLVRTILGVDEKANALIFAGDMPLGYLAQLMHANFERIIDGASLAAQQTAKGHFTEADNTLLISISCVGRRLVLGERTEEEVESTLEAFSGKAQQIGFYSYGEISPDNDVNCELHNQTMTITSITERS